MSKLVGYGSSDEDNEESKNHKLTPTESSRIAQATQLDTDPTIEVSRSNGHANALNKLPQSEFNSQDPSTPLIGPSAEPSLLPSEFETVSVPLSPYSATRATIHDLTLPSVPNLNIPGSPPGSPPPGVDKKIGHFLQLKKQGIHFNEKLAGSSALKNPSLLQKLMQAAGIQEHEQYATTLPPDLWDPTGFPPWAFKEELAKSQKEVSKQLEERAKSQRESIEFVSATASDKSSRAATPASSNAKGLKGSAAERVMAGLDRDRGGTPQASTLASRSSSNYNPRRNEPQLRQGRSRSPTRRKRSRSR